MPATLKAWALPPLGEFYGEKNQPMPRFQAVAPEAMPEPYRTLLVHNRDMTSTLEQFHGDRIHVHVLDMHRAGAELTRMVALELDGNDRIVEFGAICIHLDVFEPEARALILECRKPLGGILAGQRVAYTSSPRAFFEVNSDAWINNWLSLEGTHKLYGRQNVLRTPAGATIAEIVEILPPIG